MAKFIEAPTKPRVVHAVQYTGVEKGSPTFNEPVPTWLVSNMIRGRLAMVSDQLAFDDTTVPVGAWFIVDEGDVSGDTLRFAPAAQFFAAFRLSRRKPGPRSKAGLSVAAE